MLCPNCHNVNRDGAKFCDECGTPLARIESFQNAQHAADDVDENVELESMIDIENAAGSENKPKKISSFEGDETATLSEEWEHQFANETEQGDAEPDSAEPDNSDGDYADADFADADFADADFADAGNAELADVELDNATLDDSEPEEAPAYAPELQGAPEPIAGFETKPIGVNLAGFDRPSDNFGIDAASAYVTGRDSYRDGNTMRMPKVETEEPKKNTEFRASATKKRKVNGRAAAIAVIVVALAIGISAFASYQMQLWGGKVIPDVTNMTEADARSMLLDSGFNVKTLEIKSDDTEGLVVLSDPTAGNREEEGTEVVIHVATSREVPNIIGKTKKEAKAILAEEGYENVKFKKEKSDEPKGTVIETKPKAGKACKSTSRISVTIATPYTVPDVSGLDVDSAAQAIMDAGLQYETVEIETEDYEDGAIMGTEPAAGTEVKKDSFVTIQIAKVRGPVLESLAIDYLEPDTEVKIGAYDYIIESIDSVEYAGNDTVDFTVTARPYTHLLGQLVSGSSRKVTGTIEFSSDNKVLSVS